MTARAGRRATLALLAFAGGCTELRTAPGASLLPPDLLSGTGDPAFGAAVETAAAFRDGGAALMGRPAETARVLALLEFLAAEVPTAPRLSPLPQRVGRLLAQARDEARGAMGLAGDTGTVAAIDAYATAWRALRAGNQASAALALAAPRFQPGGAEAVARLGALGSVPTAELATGQALEALRDLDGMGRINGREASFFGPAGTPALTSGF